MALTKFLLAGAANVGLLVLAGMGQAQAQPASAAPLSAPAPAAEPGSSVPLPAWPKLPSAPAGAPNIVIIMLDDVGFGDTGTFGGPAATPNLDRLASTGLRYNNFNTTALCTPTRAALLTGRNPHQVGYGSVGEAGYPGYNGSWSGTASVAEILKDNGYSTGAFGKWHNTPFREISPVGPFDRWPTGLGFEYYYGNMLGASSQWEPILWRNTEFVQQPKSRAQGYHFTTDITDEAIRWMGTHESLAPDKPYFLYFAPEAAHMPHEVPAEWIAKYSGKFDQGWDKLREETFERQKKLGVIPESAKLTPRPAELPAWDSLPPEQRKIFSHQMEAYAGFISHADHEIGRLVDAIRSAPGGENTLIFYIVGDNGSAGEMGVGEALQMAKVYPGGDTAFYPAGWAWAGTSPFQWSKGVSSHFGGYRNPLVVSWPGHLKDIKRIRSQFVDVDDVVPTIYDLLHIALPASVKGVQQKPLDGVSFAQTFESAQALSTHKTQYFETWGNRSIYSDGWVAGARHGIPWKMKTGITNLDSPESFAADRWELYDTNKDFSEANDLSKQYPDKLHDLQVLFDKEARRNNVYPLLSNNLYGTFAPKTDLRTDYVFHAGTPTFLGLSGPDLSGKPFRIDAELTVPSAGAEGVIFSQGGNFSLYLQNGAVSLSGAPVPGTKTLTAPLAAGDHRISFVFKPNEGVKPQAFAPSPGTGQLLIDDHVVDEGKLWILYSQMGETDIGRDTASPASKNYTLPFPLTAELRSLRLQQLPPDVRADGAAAKHDAQ